MNAESKKKKRAATQRKNRAYVYARVSSEGQAEAGTSIPSQISLITRYAKDHGIALVGEPFIDEARSGTSDDRPAFRRMIAQCTQGQPEVDAILVWNLSRFSRNRYDSVLYKERLARAGVRVISVSEPIEDTAEGRLLEGIMEAMNDWQIRHLSQETLRGLKETARQGYHSGGIPPYGYRLKPADDGRKGKTVWEPHPEEAEGVRLAFRLFADGKTYPAITKALDEGGYKPRKSPLWGKASLYELFRRECYSGEHVYNKRQMKRFGKRILTRDNYKPEEEWIRVKVPALLDPDTFRQARERLKRRNPQAARHRKHLLTGLLRCSLCGQTYRVQTYKKGYPYYMCTGKVSGKKDCENRNLRADLTAKRILTKIEEDLLSPANCERFVDHFREDRNQAYIEHTQQWQRFEGQLEDLTRRYHEYCEAFETGKIPIEVLNERLTAIQEERAHVEGLRDTAATLARRESRRQKVLKKATKPALFRKFLREVLLEGEETEQFHLLSNFVREIQVHPDGLLIKYSPFVITEGHPFDPDDSGNGPGSPSSSGDDEGWAIQLVPRDGIEPPTRGFSVLCSTD